MSSWQQYGIGVLSPLAQISDRTAFVLEGETDTERIVDTDESWEVEEEKGVQPLPTPPEVQRFYYVAEPGERIDGASFDWFWNDAAHSRGEWEKAASIGSAIARGAMLQNINWQLTPDSLPGMQMELTRIGRVARGTGIPPPLDFPDAALEIPAHASATFLLDHSHLTTAYPELTVAGGAKSVIRITYAEALVDAHPNFDFLTIVAGVRPSSPGFSTVSIEPHLGSLRRVASAVATPKGMVEVNYTSKTSGVSAEINLPSNVTGELVRKGKIFSLHPGHQQLLLP